MITIWLRPEPPNGSKTWRLESKIGLGSRPKSPWGRPKTIITKKISKQSQLGSKNWAKMAIKSIQKSFVFFDFSWNWFSLFLDFDRFWVATCRTLLDQPDLPETKTPIRQKLIPGLAECAKQLNPPAHLWWCYGRVGCSESFFSFKLLLQRRNTRSAHSAGPGGSGGLN